MSKLESDTSSDVGGESTAISLLSENEAMPPKLDKDFALKFIPEFKGNRDDFHRFVNCCDVVDTDLNTADSTMLLNIIKCKLSGSAYNVVKYKNFSNWAELKKCLQEQFLERRTLAQIQMELVTCKQNFREDVRSFANRIERLLADLNDACVVAEGSASSAVVESLNGKTALKAFVDGLQNPVRLIIKASRFSKLSEAVEAAVEEEKSSYKSGLPSKPPSSKCSYCNKTGHSANNCFLKSNHLSLPKFSSPQKMEIKKEPNSPSSSYRVNVLVCSYCKNKGHHIKDCKKRAFNEARKKTLDSLQQKGHSPGNASSSGVSGGATRAEDLARTSR